MTNEVATRDKTENAALIEKVMLAGDLSSLSPAERVQYYMATCESLDLNPLTRPFDLLKLSGKLVLYANKECAAQLRTRQKVSITDVKVQPDQDGYIVMVHAVTADGRQDVDVGAIYPGNVKGEPKANAIMKAITKGKRRVTLSICGLGFLDETEVASIPGAQRVPMQIEDSGRTVVQETGEVLPFSDPPVQESPHEEPVDADPMPSRSDMAEYISNCWKTNAEAYKQQAEWLQKHHFSSNLYSDAIPDAVISKLYMGWIDREGEATPTNAKQESLV